MKQEHSGAPELDTRPERRQLPLAAVLSATLLAAAVAWLLWLQTAHRAPTPAAVAAPAPPAATLTASVPADLPPLAAALPEQMPEQMPEAGTTDQPPPAIAAAAPRTVVPVLRKDRPVATERQPAGASGSTAASSGFKQTSPQQRADNLYRQAIAQIQQTDTGGARQTLQQALVVYPAHHEARQALAALLSEAGETAAATALIREGLALAPGHGEFAMMLARLQVVAGNRSQAIATLEQGLAQAADDGQYHAFLAALLQGQGRHDEAIRHYVTALRTDPAQARWLIGVGISLQTQGLLADATAAFERALDTGELMPEQAQFARRSLQQIGQRAERPR